MYFDFAKDVQITKNPDGVYQYVITNYDDSKSVKNLDEVDNIIGFWANNYTTLDGYYDEANQKIENLTGLNVEDVQKEYMESQKNVIGEGNQIQNLVNEYCQDNNTYLDKLSHYTTIAGIGMMAVGGAVVLAVPAAGTAATVVSAAAKVMSIGSRVAQFGVYADNFLQLFDDATSQQGITQENAQAFFKETMTEFLLRWANKQIAHVSDAVNSAVYAETDSKILAYLASIPTDAAMSLVADFIVTGNIDLKGEGLSQLLACISGLAGEKVNIYRENALDDANIKLAQGDYDGATASMRQAGLSKRNIAKNLTPSIIEQAFKIYENTENLYDLRDYIDEFSVISNSDKQRILETVLQQAKPNNVLFDDNFRDIKPPSEFDFENVRNDFYADDIERIDDFNDRFDIQATAQKEDWNSLQIEVAQKLQDLGLDEFDIVNQVKSGFALEQCELYQKAKELGVNNDSIALKGASENWSESKWQCALRLQEKYRYNPYVFQSVLDKIEPSWSQERTDLYVQAIENGKTYDFAVILSDTSLTPEQRTYEVARLGLKAYQANNMCNMMIRSADGNIEKVIEVYREERMFNNEPLADFLESGYDTLAYATTEPMTLCRYEYSHEGYDLNLEIGSIFTNKAFTSTTTDMSEKSWAKNFVQESADNYLKENPGDSCTLFRFDIEIPTGAKIVTGDDSMGEVLLKYNSTFEVVSFDSVTNTYKLRLII